MVCAPLKKVTSKNLISNRRCHAWNTTGYTDGTIRHRHAFWSDRLEHAWQLSGMGDSQRDSRESIRANRFARIIRNWKTYFYSASGRFARITRISCESICSNHATKRDNIGMEKWVFSRETETSARFRLFFRAFYFCSLGSRSRRLSENLCQTLLACRAPRTQPERLL